MIPGENLLATALTVIAPVTVSYQQAQPRGMPNAIGYFEPTYADAVPIQGSFQPVPKNLYSEMGLDLTKTYFWFYTTTLINGINRDVTNDLITFAGNTYQCESPKDWYNIDGWNAVLVSQVSN